MKGPGCRPGGGIPLGGSNPSRPTYLIMNIQSVLLLAALLCAECPACDIEERWLIAQTVVYRAKADGASIYEIIHAPRQYQGIGLVDIAAYLGVRRRELEENLAIAWGAVLMGPAIEVSNFARPGCADWQSRCELKYIMGKHYFHLCPAWKRKNAREEKNRLPRSRKGRGSQWPEQAM